MRILIIEDEKLLADSLKALLEQNGFEADAACDGKTGEYYAALGIYDLLILDVMMPERDGYEVARRLRERRMEMPILMLTARSELDDRVTGLNAGADYYLTKPFDTRELLACVNALLRRQGVHVDVLSFGNTVLDLASATLVCGAERIRLSSREFEIMRLLLRAEGNNISKETILTKVWGYDSDAVENHVEVYIGFLRKKLANIGSNVRIEAIRRLGYHLEVCVHAKKAAAQICVDQHEHRDHHALRHPGIGLLFYQRESGGREHQYDAEYCGQPTPSRSSQ